MNNPSRSINQGVCRRSVLKTVPAIVGAIVSTNAMADVLFAQTKLTHEAAKYQDSPKDGQQCSGCVSSWHQLPARSSRIPLPRVGGASSSRPSQLRFHLPSSA